MGKPFIIPYSLFIAVMGLTIAASTTAFQFVSELNRMLWFCFAFFGLLTPLLHYIISRGNPSPASFVRKFLLVTTLKFFLFALIAISVTILAPSHARNFLLAFLFCYLPFTAFETIMQYKGSKTNGEI